MEITKLIDHTNVNPNCKLKDVKRLIAEAKKFGFYSVVVLPYYAKIAKELAGELKVGSVIGFPFGVQPLKAKLEEIKEIRKWVDELDVVMNRAAFKNKDYDFVLEEMEKVVKAAKGKVVKIIIETPELTQAEIKKASKLVLESGADFVKTAVGLKGKTKVEHVKLIKKVVGEKIGIKASGGIRSLKQALAMIKAGATRLGCSRSVEIISQYSRL